MRSPGWVLAGWLVLAVCPTAFSAEYLLYKPQPAGATVVPANPEEGILVTGVTVRQGDTLKRLSRKYRGKSSYFPQILLFNKIADPDMIRAGSRLMIPLAAGHAPPKRQKKHHSVNPRLKTPKRVASAASAKTQPIVPAADPSLMQYNLAVAAYKNGQLRKALQEFDQFLAKFPNSPLAADASLYRADCLLNLSQQ